MAGNNDRIHGYNAVYRNSGGSSNFHSFELKNRRPDRFINRPVNIIGDRAAALDHQGHIVPQNMLNLILDPLMERMAVACNNDHDVANFINGANVPWLQLVLNYGTYVGAPMFDFEDNRPENRVGNFFAIVTWNPVNICRAPEDTRRGGIPGTTIDLQVMNYLNNNRAAQNINAAWLLSLQTIIANPTNTNINNYITACCNTLAGQLQNGIGYYSFPWQNNAGTLVP